MNATWDWELVHIGLKELMAQSQGHVTLDQVSRWLSARGARHVDGRRFSREMIRLALRSNPKWSNLWDENMARPGRGRRSRYAAR